MEFVDRWYPFVLEKLRPEDIWGKKEIGCYIHIPFCKSICHYCHFNKCLWQPKLVEAYLDALKTEIRMYKEKPYLQNARIIAVHIGGGTPNSLSITQLSALIQYLRCSLDVDKRAEISMDVNPDIEEEKLMALFEMGVNRISFGIQSFNDSFLRLLGRTHTSKKAISIVKLAQEIGYPNINIDLLYRIPGQKVSDWQEDLQKVISLAPHQVSCNSLSIYPGTEIYNQIRMRKIPQQPSSQIDAMMLEKAIQMLGEAGYRQYTVVDFTKPGKESIYHLISWGASCNEYIGFGNGAYSFIHGYQYFNIPGVHNYIKVVSKGRLPVFMGKKLTRKEEMSRYLVLGTRCLRINKLKFKEIFGFEVEEIYGETLQKLQKQGLITIDKDYIRLTNKGILFANEVSKAFYTKEHVRKRQLRGIQLVKEKKMD